MTSWRCRCSAVSSCPLGALVTPRPSHPHPCPAPAASPWLRLQGGPAQGATNGTRAPDSDRLGEPLRPPSGCCLWVGRSGFRASLWGCQGPAGPGPLVRLWEGSTGLPRAAGPGYDPEVSLERVVWPAVRFLLWKLGTSPAGMVVMTTDHPLGSGLALPAGATGWKVMKEEGSLSRVLGDFGSVRASEVDRTGREGERGTLVPRGAPRPCFQGSE